MTPTKSRRASTGHGTGVLQEAGLREVLSRDRFFKLLKRHNRSERRKGRGPLRGRSVSERLRSFYRRRGTHTYFVGEWETFMRAAWPEMFRKPKPKNSSLAALASIVRDVAGKLGLA